jgi:DNA-directed RNA polymerase subunit beta
VDDKGVIVGRVLARVAGEPERSTSSEVGYIDISPMQIVGVSASLIPFLEHDDANRALMGSNMQRQAVPLLLPEPPLVGTGMEDVVGPQQRHGRPREERNGTVTFADAKRIIIDNSDEYELRKFRASTRRPARTRSRSSSPGREGQGRADHRRRRSTSQNGELALGKNCSSRSTPSTATTSRTRSSSTSGS